MANTNYDVILRFLLEESSKQKTKAGIDQLTGDIGDVEKIVRAATKDFQALEQQIQQATNPKEMDRLERKLKDVDDQVKDITNSYRLQARVLRSEAANIVDGFEKVRVARLKAFGDRLGGISRTGLAASGALIGGIVAEAGRFAKEAEQAGRATQATREWTQATKELAQARARVDTVLLRESLPLIQQAAKVASQAANFIERNPVIVRAALETGKIVAGLSVLGILASKGIALYADARAALLGTQELAAAKLQDEAANKQLRAALLQAGVSDVPVPGGGKGIPGGGGIAGGLLAGIASPVGSLALIAAAGAATVDAANKLKLLEERLVQLGGPATAPIISFLDTVTQAANPGIVAIKNLRQSFERDFPRIRELIEEFTGINLGGQAGGGKAAGASAAVDSTRLSLATNRDAIVAAWEKWQEEDARIVQEAAERRLQIVRDAESRIAAASAQFSRQVSSINAAARKREESITANFLKEEARAEAQYQSNRAQMIRDGGKEIREIEEAHQERLRKMTADHNERVEDLTASRDALGLAKEQRRFNQEVAEENRSTRLEIAKRRADLAERLADLDRQHQAEKAQRLIAFQEALAENEAQRKEQLKQSAAAHAEELKQIRAQRAQQLRELQEGLNAERQRRREVFIAEIRDLDAALLGEKALRVKRFGEMLTDVDQWLVAYRAKLATLGTSTTALPPVHDYSGMAYTGIYRMAANGQPQYVLSGAATRAAEQIIGRGLTQDAILSTLARGAGSSRTINISDHSRFDGRISAREVRAIKQETIDQITRELG